LHDHNFDGSQHRLWREDSAVASTLDKGHQSKLDHSTSGLGQRWQSGSVQVSLSISALVLSGPKQYEWQHSAGRGNGQHDCRCGAYAGRLGETGNLSYDARAGWHPEQDDFYAISS
jgi:hypothetical protein